MDVDRFRDSPVGEIVSIRIGQGSEAIDHYAFVPKPLPSGVKLDDPTQLAVSEADQALGILEGVAANLPNKDLLIRPIIRREAVSTSALEGTYAELSEVLEAEVSDRSRSPRTEVHEVLNYTETAEQALSWLKDGRPITLNLIQDLHRTLVSGTRGDSPDTGRFRTVPVMIGPRGARPQDSHLIPPPVGQLELLLKDWEAWTYAEDHVPAVVRAALSHYQFETIHPFRDGNGRLGRLLIVLLLIERGPLSAHLLSVSPYLEARRGEYAEHLRAVSETGDFNPWVSFLALALKTQAQHARSKAEALLAWRSEAVGSLRVAGRRGLVIEIAEALIGYPVTTPSSAAERFGVTYRAANRAIATLVANGLLEEVTGRSYGRVFVSNDVMSIIAA